MEIKPLFVDGGYLVTPQQHKDPRGLFMEWYRHDRLADVVGHPLRLAQANLSVSARGVVRGIHYADVPPGQAKYVSCPRGAVLDVIVDLRVGSPTYGQHEAVRLDQTDHRAVYIAEGLGHGFCALTEDATLVYLCAETYAPQRERAINPLDPQLAIEWPASKPVISERDAAAPTLSHAADQGLLPTYEACQAYYRSLDTQQPLS